MRYNTHMFTRHFHATFLAVVGIILVFGLSILMGQKPHLPKISTSKVPTITVTPTPTPQTTFLYYDYNNSFDRLYQYTIESNSQQGIYGAYETKPNQTPYTSFSIFNSHLYLQNTTSAANLNLVSHFLYPVETTSLPLTVSPSNSKAIFVTKVIDPNTKQNTSEFQLQTISSSTPQEIPYIQELGSNPQPICWSHYETSVIFQTQLGHLYLFSLEKKTATRIFTTPVANIANIYCNSETNTLYYQTYNGLFSQKFTQQVSSQINISDSTLKQLQLLIFPSDLTKNIALTSFKDKLMTLNLQNGETQTLYTATDSATLIPYLWKGNEIIYTQQSNQTEQGEYYLAGKVFDTKNNSDNTFAYHQANKIINLGEIIPILLISQQKVQ